MRPSEKKYIIESKGFRNFGKSLLTQKEELEQMIKDLAIKYNMTIEEVRKELNK